MRKKPDVSHFTVPKNPTAFLEGGAADVAEKLVATETPHRGRGKVQKLFNFPVDLADQIRDEAVARSRATGRRVTEKDIVIAALDAYFNSSREN